MSIRVNSSNCNFFREQSLVSSYWAGFLAADGYITGTKEVAIKLAIKDVLHLKNFVDNFLIDESLNSENFEYQTTREGYKSVRVRFVNASQWTQDLKEIYNITPRKSLTLVKPNINNFDNQLAFIAGYIDGDGSINIHRNSLTIQAIGTESVLIWILAIIHDNFPSCREKKAKARVHLDNKHRSSFVYEFQIGAYQGLALWEKLCTLNLPLLERKWDKARIYKENYLANKKHSPHLHLVPLIREQISKGIGCVNITKQLNVPLSLVRGIKYYNTHKNIK